MTPLRTGKKPATRDPRDLHLEGYLLSPQTIKVPANFGHQALIHDWGMLGNDTVGDCVLAGACHETMLLTAESGKPAAAFTPKEALAAYGAVTGYTPTDPDSDRGTDVRNALTWRRTHGLADAHGRLHKIAAFAQINTRRSLTQLRAAAYVFGAVGIGVEFPTSAMAQFNAGQPWTVVESSPIDDGHYIPLVGFHDGWYLAVTWGQIVKVAPAFITRYCDEAWAIFSTELLHGGKSPEGFNTAQLRADVAKVTR